MTSDQRTEIIQSAPPPCRGCAPKFGPSKLCPKGQLHREGVSFSRGCAYDPFARTAGVLLDMTIFEKVA